MKLLSFFRITFLTLLIIISLLTSLAFGYYQFGDRQTVADWQISLFGYRLTSNDRLVNAEKVRSTLENLSQQFDQLAAISKDIKQQFLSLQTSLQRTETTAEKTRTTIADALAQLADLETSLNNQQSQMERREQELDLKIKALNEAEKTIKNLQRQLRASSVERLDNDALALEYEMVRLSRTLADYPDQVQFIQTSLRKGIVVLPFDLIFESQNLQKLSPPATDFLYTVAYTMENLPTATLKIIQKQSASKLGQVANAWHSQQSATVAQHLIEKGLAPNRILVASQPGKTNDAFEPTIELHISL